MERNPLRQLDGLYSRTTQLVIRTWKTSPYRKYVLTATGIFSVIGAGLIILNNVLPANALVQPNGRLYYGDATNTGVLRFQTNTFDFTFNGEVSSAISTTSSHIAHTVAKTAPTRDEIMVGHLKVDGRLDVIKGINGYDVAGDYAAAWNNPGTTGAQTCNSLTQVDCTRAFDIAYERLSGRAMVVYADTTAQKLYYCYWDGSAWGPVTNCAPTASTNDITLTANGRPTFVSLKAQGGSNKILLGVSIDVAGTHEVESYIWDGSSWGTSLNATASTNATTLALESGQAFDVEWESLSNEAMIVFGSSAGSGATKYFLTSSGSWGSEQTGPTSVGSNGTIMTAQLEADPVSNRILYSYTDDANDSAPGVWKADGSTVGWTMGNEDGAIENNDTGVQYSDIAWENAGTEGLWVVQSNATTVDVDYQTITCNGSGCTFGTITNFSSTGLDDGTFIRTAASPNSRDIMVIWAEIDRNLHADHWDGGAWEAAATADLSGSDLSPGTGESTQFHGVSAAFAYVPYQSWQRNWRFYDDETVNDPSTGLNGAAENATPTSVDPEEFIRLRMNVNDPQAQGQTDSRKKLQYTSGASCTPDTVEGDTDCTWADVGDTGETTATWRYATSGETCASCSDNTAVATARLTGTTQNGTYISDKDAAGGGNMDHNANAIAEWDFPLKAEGIAGSTTYYFRLYDVDQDRPVRREQDNDGSNDCASATCTYPSLTTVAGYTVSGTVFMANESTTGTTGNGGPCDSSTAVLSLRTNGSGVSTTSCSSSDGTFSFTSAVLASSGETIAIYLTSSMKANTVYLSDGGADTGIDLYENRLAVGHKNAGPIVITDMDAYDSDQNNTDMLYDAEDAAPDTLIVESGNELHIRTSETFTPGGNVTTSNMHIVGTYTATTTETITVNGTGTLWTQTGTFNAASSTVVMNTNADVTLTSNNSITFFNLTLSPTFSVDGHVYTFGTSALAIDGDFLVSPACGACGGSILTVNLGANITVASTKTTTLTGTGAGGPLSRLDLRPSTTDYNLTTGFLNVATDGTLDAGGSASIITLTGTSGTLFTRVGTFTQGTSEVVVTSASGTPTLLSAATTFHKLTLNTASTVVNAGAAITINAVDEARLTITQGVLNADAGNITGPGAGTNRIFTIGATGSLCLGGTTNTTTATCDTGNTQTTTRDMPSFQSYSFNVSSTVRYLSDVAQTVSSTPTYGNLVLKPQMSASRIYTLGGAMTIDGNFTITSNSGAATFVLTVDPSGDITVANGKTTTIESANTPDSSATLDLMPSATPYNLTTGHLTIATGGTLDATGTSSTIAVSGNYTGTGGVFNEGTSTVTMGGTASGTLVTGCSDTDTCTNENFYNLTIDKTDADEANDNVTLTTNGVRLTNLLTITNGELVQGTLNVRAEGTSAVSIAAAGEWNNISTGDLKLGGTFVNAGAAIFNSNNGTQCVDAADDIAISSTSGGSQRNWSGAGTFTLRNLNVTDMTDSSITAYTSAFTNTTWTDGSCGTVVSGGCFTDESESTPCGDAGPEAIKIAVNGIVDPASDPVVDGSWSVTTAVLSANDILVIFIDGEATESEEATTIVKYDGTGNITNVRLYQSQLVIGADSGSTNTDQTITAANLDPATTGYENTDSEYVLYDYTAGADITVDAEGTHSEQLYIINGDTYQPASGGGSDTTTERLTIDTSAVITADTNALTVSGTSGTLFTNNGTFTQGTSTVNITSGSGTPTFLSGATSFHVLTINAAATVVNMGSAVTINAVDNAQLNITSGVFNVDAANITGPGTGTGRTLTISAGAKLCLGGTTGSTSATCNNSATQTATRDMPTFNAYTFSATSTVSYLTNVAQTVDSTPDYGHLILNPTITALRTYTFEGATDILGNFDVSPDAGSDLTLTVNMAGDITVAATTTTTITRTGSNASSLVDTMPSATPYNLSTGLLNVATGGTLDSGSATSTITLTGTSGTLLTVAGAFTEGSSTVVFNGNGTPTALNGNTAEASTFNNLSLTPALSASGKTYAFGTTALIVNGDFLIHPTSSQLLTVNPGASITVASTKTTTITGTTATSKLDLRPSLTDYNLTTGFLSIGANGTLDAAAAASVITLNGISGTLFTNAGAFTQGISDVQVTSASGTPTLLSGATTFHKLTINAAATIINMGSAVTINNVAAADLTITAGVFNIDANDLVGPGGTNGTLSVAASATLCLGGTTNSTTATCNSGATQTATRDLPTFNAYSFNTTSTVSYLSNVAQTISVTPSYGNLNFRPTLTAGRIYTFGGTPTITGNLDLNPDAASALALTVNMAGDITIASAKTLTITRTGSNATSVLDTRPSLTNYNVTTYDLTIAAGGTLDATGSVSAINISNNYSNSGTFTAGLSVTTFTATDAGNTLSGTMTGGSAFYDLIFNGVSGAWAFNAAVAAGNDFTVTNGAVTASNNNLTVTRDVTLANTAGVSYVAGSSTLTINRHFNDTGNKFSEGTSTVSMEGTGTVTGGSSRAFFNLNTGFTGFTTTLSNTNYAINGLLTFNGGTTTSAGSWIDLRCPTVSGTCTRVQFNAATTISGTRSLYYTANANLTTHNVAGGNYGTWSINMFTTSGTYTSSIYTLQGNVSGTNAFGLEATNSSTGNVFNTGGFSISNTLFNVGNSGSGRTAPWTANFGASVVTLTSTGDSFGVNSNGGSHTFNLSTASISTAGSIRFVNGTGTVAASGTTSTITMTPAAAATRTFTTNTQTIDNFVVNGGAGAIALLDGDLIPSDNLTITAGTLDVSASNYIVTIGGNYSNSGTFDARASTVVFNATDAGNTLAGTMTGSSAFNALTFNGSGGDWTPSAAITVEQHLTMTAGSLLGSQNITVNQNVQGTNGIINLSGGTFEQATNDTSRNFGTTSGTAAWTFSNLTFRDTCAGPCVPGNIVITTQTGGTGGITVTGVLKVSDGADVDFTDLDAGNRTWTLSGTGGDPFLLHASSDLVPATSTFAYTGNNGAGDTTVQSETYNILQVNNGSEIYNLEGNTSSADTTVTAGTLALNGFTLTATNDLTVNGTLSGATNVTVNGSSTGSGSVTLTGGTFEQRVAAAETFGSSSGTNEWRFATLILSNSSGVDRTISPNAGTGTVRADTLFQIGRGTDTNRTTLDNNTANDRILDVNGSLSITALGTLSSSNNQVFTVGDDWTLASGGVFTHNSGTVTFDTTATAVFNGATTFFNFTSTTAAKTLQFTAGQTFTIATSGVFTITGAADPNEIQIQSTTASQWFINHQGTESVSFAQVINSGCDVASTDITTSSSVNDGNNGTCWKFDPVFSQEDFRFGQPNGVDIDYTGAPAENTAYTTSGTSDDFRLRLLVHVADTQLNASGKDFKLQFGEKTAATCASGVSWGDVATGSGVIRYFDGSPADGADLTANGGDPAHGAHNTVEQDYEEVNNFTNSVAAVSAGEDGLWDFSLINNSAVGGKRYCFRAVESGGTVFANGYNQYPEVIVDEELVFTLDATSKDFGVIQPGDNPTNQTSTLTVTTNSSTGYVIYGWTTQAMTKAAHTIPDWAGTNSSPSAFDNGEFGFGYSTNDSSLTGGTADRFTASPCPGDSGTAPCYAGFTHTGPGDPVADRTTGPVSSQANTITYRLAATTGQQAGKYETVVVYVASVTF